MSGTVRGRPIRVLHAMAGAEAGGAEKFVVRLCVALARAGIEERVLIRGHEKWIGSLRAGGIESVEAPFRRRLDGRTGRIFRREIERFQPDIVLTHMSRASAICPTGRFVHIARLGGYYDLKYYRRCDHLIGNTSDLRDYFVREGWPPERAHFISNFADENGPGRAVERGFHATPAEAPLLLALGRLHHNKGFDVLLHALQLLPGAYLWIGGTGPLAETLARLADRLQVSDRVRFLGWIDEPAPYFAAADVCVVPSRIEPLGNVILEAWVHGVPVVAAASRGPSFLIDSEESGLLAPAEDAAALAAAVHRVCADRALAARLVAGGRAAYRTSFSEEVIIDRYRQLFTAVLARNRVGTP